eukprot:sb/3470490/
MAAELWDKEEKEEEESEDNTTEPPHKTSSPAPPSPPRLVYPSSLSLNTMGSCDGPLRFFLRFSRELPPHDSSISSVVLLRDLYDGQCLQEEGVRLWSVLRKQCANFDSYWSDARRQSPSACFYISIGLELMNFYNVYYQDLHKFMILQIVKGKLFSVGEVDVNDLNVLMNCYNGANELSWFLKGQCSNSCGVVCRVVFDLPFYL